MRKEREAVAEKEEVGIAIGVVAAKREVMTAQASVVLW